MCWRPPAWTAIRPMWRCRGPSTGCSPITAATPSATLPGLPAPCRTRGKDEQVAPGRMAVNLDDGRSVAFYLKDYAHVDHGYAATIHKSQGVTVDRAHVLATPGMDRHSAYVALSRHRDGVQLHYGRDDFGDDRRLVRTLSRERAKDMASDYGRDRDAEIRAFADRRGLSGEIRLPERAERSPVEILGPRAGTMRQMGEDPRTVRDAGDRGPGRGQAKRKGGKDEGRT